MRQPDLPQTRDLVLVGGGHAHALLLRRWGMTPLPGARVTLVNPAATTPYTGMLPGHVAGHYDRDTLDIDLVRLARFAGARIVFGRATGIDRAERQIAVEDTILGDRIVGYDVASLDIGIHSDMPDLPGFAEHGVPAKPLGPFAARWDKHLAALKDDPSLARRGIAVIGGGVAGAELAMAMRHGAGPDGPLTVLDAGRALAGVGHGAERALRAELTKQNIALIEKASVERITEDAVILTDGRRFPAAFVTGAAGARPHDWLGETGLTLHQGFVAVDATLRSVNDPAIFAAGDCAHMTHAPRPKAGVFAVRQAPILHHNLRVALAENGRMRRYRPQRDYLKLISTGRKAAVADKAGLRLQGTLLWRWKDRIDRKFMRKLSVLPRMDALALPRMRAAGLTALADGQAPCGGCAAKVGRGALTAALAQLPDIGGSVVKGIGDDAAVIRVGDRLQVLTVDQLRPVTDDPALMMRIAATHAVNDCLAMGAVPHSVLLTLTLPRLSPRLEERTLAEIMAEAAATLTGSGAAIVGGHTATGPEAAYGLTVTGLLEGEAVGLDGGKVGDALILTRPLGTGVILAAEMATQARGTWVEQAFRTMATPQIVTAKILRHAHAMTDVTGFGLEGHLSALCLASGTGARIVLDRLPMLDGAAELLRQGIRSTLHRANRASAGPLILRDRAEAEILFDPQTAGGLLAAVASDRATDLLAELQKVDARAAIIGALTEPDTGIEIV
ncbi:selenide,water dikinase, putative [Oceaniovalibus guishaninsula JLT2003]|uniref:Selenide,water dikinase, putative n=1 Tax=Oceaniovalibus guishaninsula JLT2003 TaxID=1231392 RepID=K2HQR1_9RHOB|nr:selenide, water dikinase SelD [Oceaniovalibus guishaninsula]EKE45104.1 selenide,water dikinase, putative [Oceaniovalibus guishaninsula JLT2003]